MIIGRERTTKADTDEPGCETLLFLDRAIMVI